MYIFYLYVFDLIKTKYDNDFLCGNMGAYIYIHRSYITYKFENNL